MAKIYVASSWRNQYQQEAVNTLRSLGHEVYDFRNPSGRTGFQWSEVDPNWQNWTTEQYRKALNHPVAVAGFNSDFNAMQWADICVMVLPCGHSANTEAGWMAGAGKRVFVYSPEKQEPELMYKIYERVLCNIDELIEQFKNKSYDYKDQGIDLNDSVEIILTECGAKELNRKNEELNKKYPTLSWITTHREGDILHGQLWCILNNFSYEAGGSSPFKNLKKKR